MNMVKQLTCVRVHFVSADDTFLYVTSIESGDSLMVSYCDAPFHDLFVHTFELFSSGCRINLLNVSIDDKGTLHPELFVFEPDYLLDISSLAECFRDYGSHPANYLLTRLHPIDNARPLLLGNIVNLFLDEWIHSSGEVDYAYCMQKAFRRYPIELAACSELQDPQMEREFFAACRLHFDHLREMITQTFTNPVYRLNRSDAVLEPAYICEALGLQGRLDYMQRDMTAFIEMKSGKADEFTYRGRVVPKMNNLVQMLLYQAVLHYSMGQPRERVKAYLLYTRYPSLYPATTSWQMVAKALDLRNRIVASEYLCQKYNSVDYTRELLDQLRPEILNERRLSGKLWQQYLLPDMEKFHHSLTHLSALEQNYYNRLYTFIVKEQYCSKQGYVNAEGRAGASSLWLSSFDEKRDSGEILFDLKILENGASDPHKSFVRFQIPSYLPGSQCMIPNFRQGDAVLFYEREHEKDNATNKLVFKGNVEVVSSESISVRLRATQHNTAVIPTHSLYAVEHDFMDSSFRVMFQSLAAFTKVTQHRRDLLLGQRPPVFDQVLWKQAEQATDDFERVSLKAMAAQDFFLLIGPPGTGKTSFALKQMVERYYAHPDAQILLLAYTNRAVDEICKSVLSITPSIDFIRVGSELACEAAYRPYLLENRLATCSRRSEVQHCITNCRVFIGTVASITNRPELFNLKRFQVAIVDEATQILEPQLLGILCATHPSGEEAVERFILIGDHKQLPAVVLQTSEESEVKEEPLRRMGLHNLKDSLFERLYRSCPHEAVDMLCRQGRMNPAVALFPNQAFYGGKLQAVGLPHQSGELFLSERLRCSDDVWARMMNQRVVFFPSNAETKNVSGKSNLFEAKIAAHLARLVYEQYESEFDEHHTLGIITPYRSQIALIKQEIARLNQPQLNRILVDTVERYQGSERDVIIYSFCVNHSFQLSFLSNVILEGDIPIDRKLNVALTRARKQLFIIGNPELLEQDDIYRSLLKLIR